MVDQLALPPTYGEGHPGLLAVLRVLPWRRDAAFLLMDELEHMCPQLMASGLLNS